MHSLYLVEMPGASTVHNNNSLRFGQNYKLWPTDQQKWQFWAAGRLKNQNLAAKLLPFSTVFRFRPK
jgi:hypothetical protein